MTYRALALFAAPAILAAAPAESPDLVKVQAHLQAVQTMTATFAQTDRNGRVLNGVMSLKRPGKIRFQYEKGVPILIVGDGSALTFIDYQVKQVQRWPIGKSPLGVLLDPKRDISGFAKSVPTADPSILSIEANDPKHPEFGRITMIFQRDSSSPAGLKLIGWVALDSQGNRTTIRLTNQHFNGPIADGTFRWNDPRTTNRGR